eukprot:5496276-Alexandrium_andersonii.AAC.1
MCEAVPGPAQFQGRTHEAIVHVSKLLEHETPKSECAWTPPSNAVNMCVLNSELQCKGIGRQHPAGQACSEPRQRAE